MAGQKIEMIGRTFGLWTVIGECDRRAGSGSAYWKCKCSCGNTSSVLGTNLRNNSSNGCTSCAKRGVEAASDTGSKRLYRSLVHGAIRRNIVCEITYERFLEIASRPCWICGSDPHEKRYAYSRPRYSKGVDGFTVINGIDRLDSDGGYVEGNVESCCSVCNRMKNDLTVGQFKLKISNIYNHLIRGNNNV